jgi:hypothetical protein
MRSQKKKAGILFAFAVFVSLMILGGCGKQKEPGAYHIEYLNSEKKPDRCGGL